MNKLKLVTKICEMLEQDRIRLKEAAQATYEAATHEESKPENEYDTRGLEASYLAGAQAQRVAETEEILFLFRALEKNLQNDRAIKSEKVVPTSLVEVEHNGKKSFVLVMPKGGGIMLSFDNHAIQVVTPSSPLGGALMGLEAADVASVEAGAQVREYDILKVI